MSKKYVVYIHYTDTSYIEVKADSEEQAIENATNLIDIAEPYGDTYIDYEVEELDE